jgi:hypothetical protein
MLFKILKLFGLDIPAKIEAAKSRARTARDLPPLFSRRGSVYRFRKKSGTINYRARFHFKELNISLR